MCKIICKPGGLNLSRHGINRGSQSQHWKELVSTVEKNLTLSKSWSWRSRYLDLVSMAICMSSTSWLRSRLIQTCKKFVIACDFCGFLDYFLDLNWEIAWFFTNLNQDIYFNCRNLWKVVGEAQGKQRKVKVKPSPTTFHILSWQNLDLSWKNLNYLQISQKSRFVSKVSIYPDDLDKNLDTA